ncbi:ABC transporter substrate-binding protein [Clostridium hydrogenum]|uniref:ABC transporter substrate-binding protein n=1 Tax=Clostridium hydrogenum TaxID=2855764 RepID=UPI001F48F33D|nr:ABC transporter substrate-binding protein [Clostridium hydrogenum]
MKKRQLVSALAAVMATSVVLTACGSSTNSSTKPEKKENLTNSNVQVIKATDPSKVPAQAKNRKDTIVVGEMAAEGKFNPLYQDNQYDTYINNQIFDSLLDVDDKGQPINGLATYSVSKDGLTYTFKLKDGVKYTNGDPVTVSDAEFCAEVIADKSYDGPSDLSSCGIKGYDAFHNGTASSISGIKVVDKDTLEITLDAPNSSALISLGSLQLMDKNYYGKGYTPGNTSSVEKMLSNPIGSGPYKLTAFKSGQEADLVANDDYWRGKVKTKNLIFKFTTDDNRLQELKTGDTDIDYIQAPNPEIMSQVQDLGFVNTTLFPDNGYSYIGMNLQNPMFKDKRVRQALTYGLQRSQIINTVYGKYADVSNEPTSTVSAIYNSDVNKYEYNVAKANKLLDEAGWKKGSDGIREKDGKKLEIHFYQRTPHALADALVPVAKTDWQKIGVKLIPETMDSNTMYDKVKKSDFEMYCGAWGLTGDPDQSGLFGSKGPQNYVHYSNSDVDSEIAKALKTIDLTKRNNIDKDVMKKLNDDAAYIFMAQVKVAWPVSSRITGLDMSAFKDFSYSLWKAEIK